MGLALPLETVYLPILPTTHNLLPDGITGLAPFQKLQVISSLPEALQEIPIKMSLLECLA